MNMFLKSIIISLASYFLLGCTSSYTHEYLLQHPDTLQSELAKCRSELEYTSYCDMVKHTSDEFSALINVRSENQIAFGKQVLQAQVDVVTAKQLLDKAKEAYEMLRVKNSTDPELKLAQQQLDKAEQNYQTKLEKSQTLLAVIAAMSAVGL